MPRPSVRNLKLLKLLVCTALIASGVSAAWLYFQGRQTGRALEETLAAWPSGGNPPRGTRQRLREGNFVAAAAVLRPATAMSTQEESAAERFLSRNPDLRRRFLHAVANAQAAEAEGADAGPVREALTRALNASAWGNGTVVDLNLELAETDLSEGGFAAATSAGPIDGKAVERLFAGLAPGFELARSLMTEGYTAAEMLLVRASRNYGDGQFADSAALISLAGQLLALEPTAVPASADAGWFEQLASRPAPDVSEARAKAVVDLCMAMAAAETPSAPLQRLLGRVRREAGDGRLKEAGWWATVALAALGMSEEEIAAVGADAK